ncbi:hypothetical protein [Paenibacillus hamazuiensis]|uniref:hypothetical protein n=1 Tax=Paenibacillus hamazuiensis TaxID=2936508 RepID=UPI00201029C6|nr:hypothetical protein [Paenibacillus hamazuiensis]
MRIINVKASHSKDKGYLGHVEVGMDGHKSTYEVTLQSDDSRNWNYSLNFAKESGSEEEIEQLEDLIEEDDDVFNALVDAVLDKVSK